MESKSLAPKYLISSEGLNAIIRTEEVIYIELGSNRIDVLSPEKTIVFMLKDNMFLYWNYKSKELAEKEYLSIKDKLNKNIID